MTAVAYGEQMHLYDPLDDLTGPYDPPRWCQAQHAQHGSRRRCSRTEHSADSLHVDGHGSVWHDDEQP